MAKVFISHSWEDNAISRKIAERLENDGAEIWVDYKKITGGDNILIFMSKAVDWCDTLVVVWSKSAKNSRYVEAEWTASFNEDRRIIFCVIDDTKPPTILSSFLYIDFKNFERGYNELGRTLKLVAIVTKAEKNVAPKRTLKKIRPVIAPVFRAKSAELSRDEVKSMLKKYNFYSKEYDWNKEYCNPNGKGFNNEYAQQVINGDKIVIDNASGLIWQQGGSTDSIQFEDAKKWIEKLNRTGYAGYHDWRLPTLEEAMSLMEPEEKNGDLYIDPMFDKTQRWIWTADQVIDERRAWLVGFHLGRCFCSLGGSFPVRAICSGQSSVE